MKRTLLLSDIFPPRTGGSGRWLWEIYRRLPTEMVSFVVGEAPSQQDFDRALRHSIIRLPLTFEDWSITRWRSAKQYASLIRRVARRARESKCEVLHCGRCLPEGLIALGVKRLTGKPYLCYVHGEDVNVVKSSRHYSFLLRRVLHGASLLIANSDSSRRLLEEDWRVPRAKIRVLYPGVDTTLFVPSPGIDRRAELGWSDRLVLMTVGRLQKRKGHDVMIAGLPHLRRRFPNILYCIVGEGEERPFLEQEAKRLGVEDLVQFAGEIDDRALVERYQHIDLFVLANRQIGGDIEGFGIVLLEAQACGKPVLAGTSGGTAETMSIPETGWVVPCDRPEPIVEAITELLGDPDRRRRMGEAARRRAVERFDWTSLAREAREVFEAAFETPSFSGRDERPTAATMVSS